MKITVKTLQQKVFQVCTATLSVVCRSEVCGSLQIDAEGSDTVGDLKKKIQEAQGHAVESQKLIYSGAFLEDFALE